MRSRARAFGAKTMTEVTHPGLSTVISATDLSTGNAVRFGSDGQLLLTARRSSARTSPSPTPSPRQQHSRPPAAAEPHLHVHPTRRHSAHARRC